MRQNILPDLGGKCCSPEEESDFAGENPLFSDKKHILYLVVMIQ